MATKSKKLHNAFTEEHLEIITKLYADTPNKVIATWMPHSSTSISKKANQMGLKKTKEYIRENGRTIAAAQWKELKENGLELKSNFKKGHVPWCKGKKMSPEHIAKLTGVFKKGQQPHNTLPIGSIRNINNYNEIKYKNHKWMALARYNWEQVHGPVPKDMCVFKLDQERYNDDINNLCLVSRKDLAMLNRNHAKLTPELKEVQILINQIKQKVR
jgi:hypothetical protein